MRPIDGDELERKLFSGKYLPQKYLTADYVKGWIKASPTLEIINKLPTIRPRMCDDAVSRTDMLECFADLYDTFEDCSKGIINELHRKFEDLRNLPSVTPKPKPCEYAVCRKAAVDAIKTTHAVNEWISCATGLMPENGQKVWVSTVKHNVEPALYIPEIMRNDYVWEGEFSYLRKDEVLAWMPYEAPNPYVPEEE